MTKTIWWTYGLSGVEVRKIFPQVNPRILEHENITYVREELDNFYFRYAVSSEEVERDYFIDRITEGYTPVYITGADNYVGFI